MSKRHEMRNWRRRLQRGNTQHVTTLTAAEGRMNKRQKEREIRRRKTKRKRKRTRGRRRWRRKLSRKLRQILRWRGRVKLAAASTQHRRALPGPAATQTATWPPDSPLGGYAGYSHAVKGVI